MGSALKINLCTIPYRPPEIILGDHGFGNEIDSWSLGCVALEALQGEVLINSEVEVEALVQIFTTMGGPLPDGYLSKLPEFKKPILLHWPAFEEVVATSVLAGRGQLGGHAWQPAAN